MIATLAALKNSQNWVELSQPSLGSDTPELDCLMSNFWKGLFDDGTIKQSTQWRGKSRNQEREEDPREKSKTQSGSLGGLGTNHVRESPPAQEAYEKDKVTSFLFWQILGQALFCLLAFHHVLCEPNGVQEKANCWSTTFVSQRPARYQPATSLFSIFPCSASGNHQSQGLAKFTYKLNMKIFFWLHTWTML